MSSQIPPASPPRKAATQPGAGTTHSSSSSDSSRRTVATTASAPAASPSERPADSSAVSDAFDPDSLPIPPPINRRSTAPLPGLSATASSLRARRSSRAGSSSLRNETGAGNDDDAEVMVPAELLGAAEVVGGPVLDSARSTAAEAPTSSETPAVRSRPPATLQAAAKMIPARRPLGSAQANDGSIPGPIPVAAANRPLASGARPTNRPLATLSSGAETRNPPQAPTQRFKGTPARAIRYSLPVRADKPVRSTKMSGKHIVLPSESQLAPLPGEGDEGEAGEDEDEDEDDDDDEDDETDSIVGDEERGSKTTPSKTELQSDTTSKRDDGLPRGATKPPLRKHARPADADGRKDVEYREPIHSRAPPKRPKITGPAYQTFERLTPSRRVHTVLPRLTSYAIGSSIHMPTLVGFLRREHGVRPRLYDECAYVVYFKPLLPGFGKAEVRSAPEPRSNSPGGESRRERELLDREESGYIGSYFAQQKSDDDDLDLDGYIKDDAEGKGGPGDRQRDDTGETDTEQEQRASSPGAHGERAFRSSSNDLGDASSTDVENESDFSLLGRRDGSQREESPTVSSPTEIDEAGMRTPRALAPRKSPSDGLDIDFEPSSLEDGEVLESRYEAADRSQDGNDGALSADEAGARDMLRQLESHGDYEHGASFDARPQTPSRPRSVAGDRDEVQSGEGGGAIGDSPFSKRHRRKGLRSKKVSGPNPASHNHDTSPNMLTSRAILEALQIAELIILPYGVLVMYNLSASEERSIINDVISSGCIRGGQPLSADDEETEAFHFCYDPTVPAPRIFNDFFTFRAPNHLLKLSLAHAIAQSTKLSVFEESMQRTLELTSHIPKELASTGELKLKRREALRLTGRLFKLRVDVNLTSNVLDTPELFWSEASLKALYDAIREYLEIDQRVENLNERLAVANDLLDVIHSHISNAAMHAITWIIILLIIVACIVACGEVTARLIVHARQVSEGTDRASLLSLRLLALGSETLGGQGRLALPGPLYAAREGSL